MSTPNHDELLKTIASQAEGLAASLGALKGAPAPIRAQARASITSNLGAYEMTIDDKYLTDDIVYSVGKGFTTQ
ncbi:hypothetical protein ACIBEA_42470 [Streptomyces sp. NPDC051555]|uniref:hypothetical protein n=1 Tax=Streptomyces sp. NPDC051555 TaxID=3365657 RepID=UPI00379767DF